MLKHAPAVIYFLCITTIIINASIDSIPSVYVAAIVIGTLAMAWQYWMERRQRMAEPQPDREQQLAHWRAQWTHVNATLAEARRRRDDRVSFLEGQLAEAERQLRKLGEVPPR